METMLTTIDNPYSPFDDFDPWFSWDVSHGYNTTGLIARITQMSTDISELDQDLAVLSAMEEIARENISGMHKMVTKEDFVTRNNETTTRA